MMSPTSGSSGSSMETLTRIAEALLQPEVDHLLGVSRRRDDDDDSTDHPRQYYYPTTTTDPTVWNSDATTQDSFSNDTAAMHWNDDDADDKATAATEEESESESEEEEEEEAEAEGVPVAANTPNLPNEDGSSLATGDEEMVDSDDEENMDEDEDAAASKINNNNNNTKHWLAPDWIPTDRCGKQIQPEKIRQQLVRFLKQAQNDGSMTKTAFLKKLGVNANSFNKFVSPNQYVGNYNERSKLNSTYMNGARFLEAERNKDEENDDDSEDDDDDFASPVATTTKSRTTSSSSSSSNNRMKTPKTPSTIHAVTPAAYFSQKVTSNNQKKVRAASSSTKAVSVHKKAVAFKTPRKTSATTANTNNGNTNRNEATALMKAVHNFECDDSVSENCVYDSPATVARQIKTFLRERAVSNSRFSAAALRGVNRKSLRRFLENQKRGSIVYGRAWQFFERLRLMSGAPKSKKRLANERQHPQGL